jgi:hypothetical protein
MAETGSRGERGSAIQRALRRAAAQLSELLGGGDAE